MNPTINDRPEKVLRLMMSEDIQPDLRRLIKRIASIKPAHPLALLLGGHSVCDPPDPISNSAVKPGSADGTSA